MRRVLIVDDNVALAENLAEALALAGYETHVAVSAADGLSKAAARSHDVIITDYRLPDTNGADLLREVRKLGLIVQAVVISAHTDDSTIEDARAAGAAFVAKPVDFATLGQLVRA
jgi:two-component system nitrogen regulation response regulator GlnG